MENGIFHSMPGKAGLPGRDCVTREIESDQALENRMSRKQYFISYYKIKQPFYPNN